MKTTTEEQGGWNPHRTARHQTDWNFLAPGSSDLKNFNNYDQNPPKFQPDLRDNNDHVDNEDNNDDDDDDVVDLADCLAGVGNSDVVCVAEKLTMKFLFHSQHYHSNTWSSTGSL